MIACYRKYYAAEIREHLKSCEQVRTQESLIVLNVELILKMVERNKLGTLVYLFN